MRWTLGEAFLTFVVSPSGSTHTFQSVDSCCLSITSCSASNNPNINQSDKYEENPDLVGVHVDGFPLPPIPCREDDVEILAALRKTPCTSYQELQSPKAVQSRKLNHNSPSESPLRILIAGGGLGGLAAASALTQLGYDVHVLEQATHYKPFGGPIQIQSNALWAIREINPILFEAIQEAGVCTGDRLSGIKDGIRCQEGWLVQFDAATPALKNNLPLTLAINRVALQAIFLKYGVPEERIHTSSKVLSYSNLPNSHGVQVTLQNGDTLYGDVLIGADGIWSRVRHQMKGLEPSQAGPAFAEEHARFSGYTCYTGTCQHTPEDIKTVAYKVFLGQEQYWGCTDTGGGWQHWWAFLKRSQDASDKEETDGMELKYLLQKEFAQWSPEIHSLLEATSSSVIKRRDLYDRFPETDGWIDGYVALLGDACHPTMPNLGQGGAMAIEDAYVLAQEFHKTLHHTDDIPKCLKQYEQRRFVRSSIAHFLSRNGSDLLVDWDRLRNTPVVGPIAMWCINQVQPWTMNYLYSSKF